MEQIFFRLIQMIIKPKNTERIRRHNLHTAEIILHGQNGGRIYISESEQTNPIVYVIDEESFLKHFDFTFSVDAIPECVPQKFRDSGIQIVKI